MQRPPNGGQKPFHWPFAPRNAVWALCCCVESWKHRTPRFAMFWWLYAAKQSSNGVPRRERPMKWFLASIWRPLNLQNYNSYFWNQHRKLQNIVHLVFLGYFVSNKRPFSEEWNNHNLKSHTRNVHESISYDCIFCSKSFSYLDSLREHEYKNHLPSYTT